MCEINCSVRRQHRQFSLKEEWNTWRIATSTSQHSGFTCWPLHYYKSICVTEFVSSHWNNNILKLSNNEKLIKQNLQWASVPLQNNFRCLLSTDRSKRNTNGHPDVRSMANYALHNPGPEVCRLNFSHQAVYVFTPGAERTILHCFSELKLIQAGGCPSKLWESEPFTLLNHISKRQLGYSLESWKRHLWALQTCSDFQDQNVAHHFIKVYQDVHPMLLHKSTNLIPERSSWDMSVSLLILWHPICQQWQRK